jgi:hypothetical protein
MLLEMLMAAIVWLMYTIGKMFFRLVQKLFKNAIKFERGTFVLNKAQVVPVEALTNANQAKDEHLENNYPESRYSLKQALLTPSERNFLDVLRRAVGYQYIIESQVPLSGIVTPIDSNKGFVNYHDFNQIKAKSVDFVLYNKDFSPFLCIELDDLSHLQWNRVKRDAFVDGIMNSVGLRIIHIRAAHSYNLENLRAQIFNITK